MRSFAAALSVSSAAILVWSARSTSFFWLTIRVSLDVALSDRRLISSIRVPLLRQRQRHQRERVDAGIVVVAREPRQLDRLGSDGRFVGR